MDLYILMDFSNSMSDDLNNLKQMGEHLGTAGPARRAGTQRGGRGPQLDAHLPRRPGLRTAAPTPPKKDGDIGTVPRALHILRELPQGLGLQRRPTSPTCSMQDPGPPSPTSLICTWGQGLSGACRVSPEVVVPRRPQQPWPPVLVQGGGAQLPSFSPLTCSRGPEEPHQGLHYWIWQVCGQSQRPADGHEAGEVSDRVGRSPGQVPCLPSTRGRHAFWLKGAEGVAFQRRWAQENGGPSLPNSLRLCRPCPG